MTFYIYQHRKADTNKIFYVGKGKGTRLNQSKGRNQYWHRVVARHGFIAEYIAKNIDEELAFLAEIECIDVYKRRGIQLVNATDGGEGATGYKHTAEHKASMKGNKNGLASWGMTFKDKKHTEESRQKMSNSRIGNKNKAGTTLSEESKAKISLAMKGKIILKKRSLSAIQVLEIRERVGYRNIAMLSREYGVGESTIRRIRDGEVYKDVK
jgi:hypothetical protein